MSLFMYLSPPTEIYDSDSLKTAKNFFRLQRGVSIVRQKWRWKHNNAGIGQCNEIIGTVRNGRRAQRNATGNRS